MSAAIVGQRFDRLLVMAAGEKNCHGKDEWRHDFAAFARDMGPRPHGMSIERVDNKKGYGPANCQWATSRDQSRNKRNNRKLTLAGRTAIVADWTAELGFSKSTIAARLAYGWCLERALTEPVNIKFRKNKEVAR